MLSVKDHLFPFQGKMERWLTRKQLDMIFFFQSLDMAAEGLLADIDPLRCSGKIHLLRSNEKLLNASYIQSATPAQNIVVLF